MRLVHSTTWVTGYPNQAAALQMKIYSTIDPRWLPNRPVRAFTQGWDLPSAKFPAPWIKFPARAKNFPAQRSREFAHKRLMLFAFLMRESPSEALFSKNSLLYRVYATTRKSSGEMIRKLSVIRSRKRSHFLGTVRLRKRRIADLNWAKVS